MAFDTSECAWAQTKIRLFGRTTIGITGFAFKKAKDKEHLFAAGDEPIDIQSGNKTPSGNVKLLKFEWDKIQDAAQLAGYEDLTDVPHELVLITCSYKKNPADPIRIIEASGVAIQDWEVGMEQNAKKTEITLPYLAMKIATRKGS